MILKGNVACPGSFTGILRYISGDIDAMPDLKPGCIFVSQGRLTVSELFRVPAPCAILTRGGGSRSEDHNCITSGGRTGEIIAFANGVCGDLTSLPEYSVFTVSMRADGDIVLALHLELPQELIIWPKKHDPIPVSTEATAEVIDSLDDLNKRLSQAHTPAEIYDVAKRLVSFAESDSVQEKYRVGELLAKAVHKNRECFHILADMTQSANRQVRFTAARCMSKMVERQPDLLPEEGIMTLLSKDLGDRSIPNLIIRALGKGKTHKHVRRILERIAKNPELSRVTREVAEFEDDKQARNYYKK